MSTNRVESCYSSVRKQGYCKKFCKKILKAKSLKLQQCKACKIVRKFFGRFRENVHFCIIKN